MKSTSDTLIAKQALDRYQTPEAFEKKFDWFLMEKTDARSSNYRLCKQWEQELKLEYKRVYEIAKRLSNSR
jgi:hypothetical protein